MTKQSIRLRKLTTPTQQVIFKLEYEYKDSWIKFEEFYIESDAILAFEAAYKNVEECGTFYKSEILIEKLQPTESLEAIENLGK